MSPIAAATEGDRPEDMDGWNRNGDGKTHAMQIGVNDGFQNLKNTFNNSQGVLTLPQKTRNLERFIFSVPSFLSCFDGKI